MRLNVWLQRPRKHKKSCCSQPQVLSETAFCPYMWLDLSEAHLHVRCSAEAEQESEDGCEGLFPAGTAFSPRGFLLSSDSGHKDNQRWWSFELHCKKNTKLFLKRFRHHSKHTHMHTYSIASHMYSIYVVSTPNDTECQERERERESERE